MPCNTPWTLFVNGVCSSTQVVGGARESVQRCSRFALGQMKRYIAKLEHGKHLVTTYVSHPSFRNQLEDCLKRGRPLLIEDVPTRTQRCRNAPRSSR